MNRYDETYFLQLALFHEDMHAEAITYTRQTLNYPMPHFTVTQGDPETGKRIEGDGSANSTLPPDLKLGDAEIPGGRFLLGSPQDLSFVFDNEMCAHPIEVKSFEISRTAVTNAEFLEFVRDDGYRRSEFWVQDGWRWRQEVGAEHPVYWKSLSRDRWLRRNFDQWVPLEVDLPVLHVNRRLPGPDTATA